VLVLGIETSTPQTSVALGTEEGTVAALELGRGRPGDEVVVPAVDQLLSWAGATLGQVGGIAVGLGPGLFTGMRVGIATAKTLAQMLGVPLVGLASLDVLAFGARYSRQLVCAVIDAKRREVFHALYRPVPGGVAREGGFEVSAPSRLAADLQARRDDILLVGNGALAYRRMLEEAGSHVQVADPSYAFPRATALVELAVPRFQREEFDRVYDLQPHYVRKSDAQIAWDERRRTG
jgi:tRNA threonylcarbamoyladenosine biosynthesis protein TsaB